MLYLNPSILFQMSSTMRLRISDELIEIAKKHANIDDRVNIYGKAAIFYIEWVLVDDRMCEYLDPNKRRSAKMKWNQNSVGHTVKQSGTDCIISVGQTVSNSVGHTKKSQSKPKKNKISDEALTIYITNNNRLYLIVSKYIQSNMNTWNISYLVNKQWENQYIYSQMLEAEKIVKKVWFDTLITILTFIKQDDFRSKQILSIAKLNRKNKDGVPYYIVIMDKIKEWKPNVISIPTV